MQNIKIIIQGSYYDSQIYSGRLYLWRSDGSILTVHWDRLVNSIKIKEHLKLALRCAFQQSEYLYSSNFDLIFHDEEIKQILKKKFDDLQQLSLVFSEQDLQAQDLILAEQDNPLPFPHADSLIYNKILYAGDISGVWGTTFNEENNKKKKARKSRSSEQKKPIDSPAIKLWDGPTLGISASYSTLALAAGNEGLYERKTSLTTANTDQLMPHHTNSTRWMYASIFSSSYFNNGYLAFFSLEKVSNQELQERAEDDQDRYDYLKSLQLKERKLEEIRSSDSIFLEPIENNTPRYVWGVHDKICLATQESIDIIQFSSPYQKRKESQFSHLGRIKTKGLQGDIVRGDSALFGFIVERDEGLLIVNSDEESSIWLEGEPVNWRIFPKSTSYTNQLHVIYEDYICIHSFNQDYFINQKEKRVGIRHNQVFPSNNFSTNR